MKKRVDSGTLPGYCSCVINKGQVVHVSEYGYSDIENAVPFTKDSIIRIYCMTKTIVAVGILILMERGKLKLTDAVSKYLPAFKQARVVKCGSAISVPGPYSASVAAKVTILRVLTHTAGFGYAKDFAKEAKDPHSKMYQPLLEAIDNHAIPSLQHYCDELAKLPLRFRPGKSLKYAMGHDVLGRIIEVVSGKSLDVFLKQEIFGPLGMVDTGFYVPKHKASRLAALYGNKERAQRMAKKFGTWPKKLPSSKYALCRIDGDRPSESNWFEGRQCKVLSANGILGSNMGGLVSTLSDQARFFTMLLNGGVLRHTRILQEETVQKWCFENLLPLAEGRRRNSGQGWNGWSALGERGMKRTPTDPIANLDEYEDGEVAMGGVANTFWSVNPVRDQVTLWFTQTLDSDAWGGDRTTKAGIQKPSPDNFTAAARTIAPRQPDDALVRRKRLASEVQSGKSQHQPNTNKRCRIATPNGRRTVPHVS